MQKHCKDFCVTLGNIPIINLRNEFACYYGLFNDEKFLSQFQKNIGPFETPYMTWNGMPDDLITLILRKIIVGLESYLPGAVYIELGFMGRLQDKLDIIRDPYKLKGEGTVDNYYHRLPSLVDEKCSLKIADTTLWAKTKIFYRDIRNPLFHGYNIERQNMEGVKNIFAHIASLYEWIDSWHDFTRVFKETKKN